MKDEMRDIIYQVKRGNKEAFSTLYRLYYPKIHSFIYRILKDEILADEITQEVFFRLWVNHKSLDETMSYDSYFFSIAKNISMDFYRQKSIEMNYLSNLKPTQIEETLNDTTSQINFSDLQKLINTAIDRMSPQQQFVFRLSREDGLKNAEIAEKLNISKRTVEKHISNSLKAIRKVIENNYMIFFM